VHPHHAATVRALVVLVRGCWKGISKAGKIHFSSSRLAAGRWVRSVHWLFQGDSSAKGRFSGDDRLES
jgi:hypothetical protein